MEYMNSYKIFAQSSEYNCETYGSGAYGTCASTTGSSSGSGSGSGSGLADTGFDIILPVALGLAIVIASVIYVVKRMRRSGKSS